MWPVFRPPRAVNKRRLRGLIYGRRAQKAADDVAVMSAGRIVEQAPVSAFFDSAQHPYTQGRIRAMPHAAAPGQPIREIAGMVPAPGNRPAGCSFAARCPIAMERCRRERAMELRDAVGLRPENADAFPQQFSGGQRQRIGIARALALQPRLLACDEPVSALDVSVQAQTLNLLMTLQRERGLAYLVIAHDLSVIRHMCGRVAVLKSGRIVETGSTGQVFAEPQGSYTRRLTASIPVGHPRDRRRRVSDQWDSDMSDTQRPLILIDASPRTKAMILQPEAEARLHDIAEVIEHYDGRMPDGIVEQNLARTALIIGQTPMDAARFAQARQLRAIINVKGNWEPVIDYGEASRLGIQVLSIAPVMAPAVAEMCLGFAIDLGRNITRNDARFRRGEDRYGIRGNETAYSLYSAPVGLIGYGNLGRALRPLLVPFDCRVAVHDPFVTPGVLAAERCEAMPLERLLATSRYIFILAGVMAGQEGFLDRRMLSLIAEDASVILASRAEVTEFDTFVELAEAGRFRAAIDVFPEEPVPAEAPVRRTGNILLSSHLAGGIHDSYRRISDILLDEIPHLLKGLPAQRLQRAEPRLAAAARSR